MYPFTGLRLLLPALVPSWRFFDAVQASPRVEYALLPTPDAPDAPWQEYCPRIAVLDLPTMLRRLLWNPQWTENLFLVSLCERLMQAASAETSAHSERELLLRVARGLSRQTGCDQGFYLQIRLLFLDRADPSGPVTSQIAYVSAPHAMAELMRP